MLLCETSKNKSYHIKKISLCPEHTRRLYARGIAVGVQIRILDKRPCQSVVLQCLASRFALGSYYTRRITVIER